MCLGTLATKTAPNQTLVRVDMHPSMYELSTVCMYINSPFRRRRARRRGEQLQLKELLSEYPNIVFQQTVNPAAAQVKGTALHFWAWGTEQPRLKCHAPEKLGPLAVSCDGSLCAGGGISGRVYVWEVSSGTLLRTWDAHYKVHRQRIGNLFLDLQF